MLQVLAIEFVVFAIEFVILAIEFVPNLSLWLLNALHHKIGSCGKHENKM